MPLSSLQMARISRLLDEALPLDVAGRRRWLETLAPEHQDLARFLRQALLPEADEHSRSRINFTLPDLGKGQDSVRADARSLQAGDRVGPYELIRLLGTGGMAEVWLARRADGVYRREVALKLPMLTRMRNDLAQRFARERDILAALEHANIARLYDAGIDPDGLPYLAMEYVQGEPLTDWCDSHRLDLRERIRLFLQVLDAVQYAHDAQVIHRDLKPTNILVTNAKQVRLLDFGVAKLLENQEAADGAPLTTEYGQALTPAYASPELVRGDPVDATSDIYSLGVVLFELLTGTRPYRLNPGASRGVLEHAIAAVDVSKPSTQPTAEASAVRAATPEQLSRQLRGDLDLIVLKALAKAPRDRYASASALAGDLERYLGGQPVTAHRPRLVYRFGKFIRRNRTAAAVTAAAVAVVLATAVYEIRHRGADEAQRARMTVQGTPASRKPAGFKSIAVLPFLDMSETKDQEYFSDGLTEELIDLLAQIKDLQVIARTSSFHFKNSQATTAEIASALGVAHLLEGSVRRSGSTVRVKAQLIRADDGAHVWSQTYDRDVKDIFQVQDEIAAAVVEALKLKLLPAETSVDPYRSDNPEAYNQYLLGKQLSRRGNMEDLRRAVAAYQKAVELDPRYAAAYAGMSFVDTKIAVNSLDSALFDRARASAEKALTLAPQLIEGFHARAVYRRETLDFAGARADAETALAIAPGDSMVQSLYGVGLAIFGRIPEATAAMNRAIELDPLNSYAWANLGLFLTAGGDYPAARRALERAIAIDQDNYSFHLALGQLDLLEGRLDESLPEFQKQGSEVGRLMGEAMIAHSRGQEPQSQKALKELIAKHTQDSPYQIGEVYAWRGENDKAFQWLKRAVQQRDSGLNGLAYDPLLYGLNNDPRWASLREELQLSE